MEGRIQVTPVGVIGPGWVTPILGDGEGALALLTRIAGPTKVVDVDHLIGRGAGVGSSVRGYAVTLATRETAIATTAWMYAFDADELMPKHGDEICIFLPAVVANDPATLRATLLTKSR